jgi:hypothetical protein
MRPLVIVRDTIARSWRRWLLITLGIAVLYHLGLIVSASITTGDLPNYVTFYDWPANVLRIIRSTPAVADMPPIIANEWLIEIGRMNYHYGNGIAEWSLAVIPAHVAVTLALAALVATGILLLRQLHETCPLPERGAGAAATGLGALCVGTANITMTFVSCCSTPTWVAGLSLMGFESSSVFVLLPYGGAISGAGFVVLLVTNYWLAWRCVPRPQRDRGLQLVTQDR